MKEIRVLARYRDGQRRVDFLAVGRRFGIEQQRRATFHVETQARICRVNLVRPGLRHDIAAVRCRKMDGLLEGDGGSCLSPTS